MTQPMTATAVADLERRFPGRDAGAKTRAVREAFGVSTTAYAQRLNQLLDDPTFLELAPVQARLLRSRRDAARHRRRAA